MYNNPNSIVSLINDTNKLTKLQQKAMLILKLDRVVKQQLPFKLQAHCRVANYRNNTLVIEVENANWLALLRFEQESLLQTLSLSILPSLTQISLYINPTINAENYKLTISNQINSDFDPDLIQLSTKSKQSLLYATEKGSQKLKEAISRLIQKTK